MDGDLFNIHKGTISFLYKHKHEGLRYECVNIDN